MRNFLDKLATFGAKLCIVLAGWWLVLSLIVWMEGQAVYPLPVAAVLLATGLYLAKAGLETDGDSP